MAFKKSKKIFSVMCAVLMIAMIFQNVSAGSYDEGEDIDIFYDSFGNKNIVWRELVNGTYQVFYAYEVVDTIYNLNDISYFNQTVNDNIDFDDGYLTIQNCEINGNIMATQAQVLIENCQINGNVKLTLGSLILKSSNVNGNVDVKNADLELRTSYINGNVKTKQNTEDTYSTIVTGNDINGNLDLKAGVCYVVGNTINGNLDIKDPATIQEVADNTVNGITNANVENVGFVGIQITYLTSNASYPQVAIDPSSGIGYILWLEGDDFYYLATLDFIEVNTIKYAGTITPIIGNPQLEFEVINGQISITWIDGGNLSFVSDMDNDLIPDSKDEEPFDYNVVENEIFYPDVVKFYPDLDLVIAINHQNDSTQIPLISEIIPEKELPGNNSRYFNVSYDVDEEFSAILKVKYDPEDFLYDDEKYQAFYWWDGSDWKIMVNHSKGEDTNVDTENDYVWVKTSHFSIIGIGNPIVTDSDIDLLSDASELNWDSASAEYITQFTEDSSTISFESPGTHLLHINVPDYIGATEYISNTRIVIDGDSIIQPGHNLFENEVQYSAANYANDIISSDFDNDGDNDVIVSIEETIDGIDGYFDRLLYYTNDCNGILSLTNTIQTGHIDDYGYDIKAIEAGYMNNDNHLDIICGGESWGTNERNLIIYYGNGDGSFASAYAISTGEGPWVADIESADFNNDGYIDIVMGGGGQLYYFENNKIGGFNTHVKILDVQNINIDKLISKDLDGNQYDDIVCSYENGHYMIMNFDGIFESPSHYSLPNSKGLSSGDFDNDGDVDILTIDNNNLCLRIYRNINGIFEAGPTLSIPNRAFDVQSADFDFDEDIDIICTIWDDQTLSYFNNQGMETFTQSLYLLPGTTPDKIYLSDLNNDNDIDLVVSDYSGNRFPTDNIITLENTGIRPSNFEIDIGNDGVPDWEMTGSLYRSTYISSEITTRLNEYVQEHSDLDDGLADNHVNVPIAFLSDTPGVVNFENLEFLLGIYETNPLDIDTDNDMIADGEEFNIDLRNNQHFDFLRYGNIDQQTVAFTSLGQTYAYINIPVSAGAIEYISSAWFDFDANPTTPGNDALVEIDIGNDGTEEYSNTVGPYSYNNFNFAIELNKYISLNSDADDGAEDGFITVPIEFNSLSEFNFVVSNVNIDIEILLTNPSKIDSDGDGLFDSEELNIGKKTDDTANELHSEGIDCNQISLSLTPQESKIFYHKVPNSRQATEFIESGDLNIENVITNLPPGDNHFVLDDTIATGNYAEDIASADFDIDGDKDVVVSIEETIDGIDGYFDRILYLSNNGDGTLTQTNVIQTGHVLSYGYDITCLDTGFVNDDLIPDIICGAQTWGTNARVLIVYQGMGDGTFASPQIVDTGDSSFVQDIISYDVNNDGNLDVIMCGGGDIYYFQNNGHGDYSSYSMIYSLPVGNIIDKITQIDADNNDFIDIVCSYQSGQLTFVNNNGVFNNPTSSLLYNSRGVATGDFNNDGMEDFVSNDRNNNVLQLYRNIGGSFIKYITLALPSYSFDILSADVNLDGYDDILCTAWGANSIYYFENQGLGSFGQEIYSFSEMTPNKIHLTDLNGDSDLDFIIADWSGNRFPSDNIMTFDNLIVDIIEISVDIGSDSEFLKYYSYSDLSTHTFEISNDISHYYYQHLDEDDEGGYDGYIWIPIELKSLNNRPTEFMITANTDLSYLITNPTSTDTDHDGILDVDELMGWGMSIDYDSDGDTDQAFETFITKCNPMRFDTDSDGISDTVEKYKGTNPTQIDSDKDTLSDYEELNAGGDNYYTNPILPDSDGDTRTDEIDVFPIDPSEWEDTVDGDGIGNNADPDDDNDGISDDFDFWPLNPTGAINLDLDQYPDEAHPVPAWWNGEILTADLDDDNDGTPEFSTGLLRDVDSDNDGAYNIGEYDEFPKNPTGSIDTDGDGRPNFVVSAPAWFTGAVLVEDLDDDNDGTSDIIEIRDGFDPRDPLDSPSSDNDGDGIPNIGVDGFWGTPEDDDGDINGDVNNSEEWGWPFSDDDKYKDDASAWRDSDMDNLPDEIIGTSSTGLSEDPDDDNDRIDDNGEDGIAGTDDDDAFPLDPRCWLDTDDDGLPDEIDYSKSQDYLPNYITARIEDTDDDGDGIPDYVSGLLKDSENNNDGIFNDGVEYDEFPKDSSEWLDSDGDGTGNNADTDDDGDGEPDATDAFPLDSTEQFDHDGDGIGDNADTDDDGDGASDAREKIAGSDPLNPDTDGDKLSDGIELNGWTVVIDYNMDGVITNTPGTGYVEGYESIIMGSNPNRPDSDFDGISDFIEWALGSSAFTADTDRDRIEDKWEYEISLKYKAYIDDGDAYLPINDVDSDGDGTRDGEQIYIWSFNPWGGDADGDGISDSLEMEGFITTVNDEIVRFYSNPLKLDSDGDAFWNGETGLLLGDDYDEWFWKTNPSEVDTDGDSLPDIDEKTGVASWELTQDWFSMGIYRDTDDKWYRATIDNLMWQGIQQHITSYANLHGIDSTERDHMISEAYKNSRHDLDGDGNKDNPTDWDINENGEFDDYTAAMITDPNNADSDGDGIIDIDDPFPETGVTKYEAIKLMADYLNLDMKTSFSQLGIKQWYWGNNYEDEVGKPFPYYGASEITIFKPPLYVTQTTAFADFGDEDPDGDFHSSLTELFLGTDPFVDDRLDKELLSFEIPLPFLSLDWAFDVADLRGLTDDSPDLVTLWITAGADVSVGGLFGTISDTWGSVTSGLSTLKYTGSTFKYLWDKKDVPPATLQNLIPANPTKKSIKVWDLNDDPHLSDAALKFGFVSLESGFNIRWHIIPNFGVSGSGSVYKKDMTIQELREITGFSDPVSGLLNVYETQTWISGALDPIDTIDSAISDYIAELP